MEKETTALFIGHREISGIDVYEIKKAIIGLIESGVLTFLCGGQGEFDITCARCVYELKKEYEQIRCILVLPYLTFKTSSAELFDETVYPEGLEKYHFKSAIFERNKYMVSNSAYALCYVCRSYGGAAKTYAAAIRSGLKIINLFK